MPFKSPAQERYMWAAHPKIARQWMRKYGSILAGQKRKKARRAFTFHGQASGKR